MYTYLILDLSVLLIPLLFSFEKNIRFYSKWKFVFPAIAITALYFLVWDYFFVRKGIWSFNPDYIIGIYILNIPLEELLFFICIPYACLFIYVVLRDWLMKDQIILSFNRFVVALIILLLISGAIHWEKTYTSVTFLSTAFLLTLLIFRWRAEWLFLFFAMYVIHLVPFSVINGILTALPVVSYNDEYIMGIKLGTIPVEDLIYSMLMLLIAVAVYEGLERRYTVK